MRLSELADLEAAYQARGWRVAFERRTATEHGGALWLPDELTQDDGTGWPAEADAAGVLARLLEVAPPSEFRRVRLVGPRGEATAAESEGDVPPEPEAPTHLGGPVVSPNGLARVGWAALGDPLSVLDQRDGLVVVGDGAGRWAVADADAMAALRGAGRPFAPPRYTAFAQMSIGDVPVAFHRLAPALNGNAPVDGVDLFEVTAGFVRHDDGAGGAWVVRR